MNRKRLIRIKGREISLTPKSKWDLKYTNLPSSLFAFHAGKAFYWEIEIEQYDPGSGSLDIMVNDYTPKNIHSFRNQQLKRPIHKINFRQLDWSNLQPFLAMYRKADLQPILNDKTASYPQLEEELNTQKMNFEFVVPFNEVRFSAGYISFNRYFNYFQQEIEIRIYNSEILPEYHLIRNFFPKALNGKEKFNVRVDIEHRKKEIVGINASSPEIEAIDQEIIDIVKLHRSLEISKVTVEPEIDKSLFTSEEFTTPFDDVDKNGNTYQQDAQDILKCLLKIKDVRNSRQLEYLAGHQQDPNHKIRFTLKPNFGFLFFVKGDTMQHYCWELLDSHATYLWSFKKSKYTAGQLRHIEEIISLIDEIGRNRYKSSLRNHKINVEENFNLIPHYSANSSLIDGFVYWKRKLKALLI